ncbi:hypothetical protein [Dyella sp. ASV21]|uniref:hypothetical protein n=1 Tax=Dyella sp. ASV21 TaxID=2795114 RepID=UPI0018EBA382|nr:hypothetical protein [Dyella sp. ASV21]
MKLPIEPHILEEANTHCGSPEELLRFLKEAGVSQSRSSMALAELMHLSHAKAKELVLTAEVWSEESRQDALDLHDGLWSSVKMRNAARPSRPRH